MSSVWLILSGGGKFSGIISEGLFKEGEKATRDVGEIALNAIGLKF
jgi:hypothetical protein